FHSASSPLAAEIGRDKIAAHHLETVAASLQGTQRAERAALILAMISGFQVMRQMIALPALADADEDELAELLGTVFERLIQRPAAGP
ncbi:TetR/AcrR family transcriptional regulator, partial [Peribacillus simplex]